MSNYKFYLADGTPIPDEPCEFEYIPPKQRLKQKIPSGVYTFPFNIKIKKIKINMYKSKVSNPLYPVLEAVYETEEDLKNNRPSDLWLVCQEGDAVVQLNFSYLIPLFKSLEQIDEDTARFEITGHITKTVRGEDINE